MDIKEVSGKTVKVSARSITVKGGNGKTCGVVNGLRNFMEVPTNVQMEFFHIVKKCGLWGGKYGDISRLFVDGKSLFYLYDTSADDFYNSDPRFATLENERTRYEERQEFLHGLQAYGENLTVIKCKILK